MTEQHNETALVEMTKAAGQLAAWSREQIELLKRTVARGTSDDEFELFVHACKRTGLDPFMKQIYAIKRWSGREKREVLSIQTGIDGYRLIAERTGRYVGSDDPVYEELDGQPVKATVVVWKLIETRRIPFTASARFSEYCQRSHDGKVFEMWQKMPYLMLGKCAEALALRKAFPAELGGVHTHEEMLQAENIDHGQTVEAEGKANQEQLTELQGKLGQEREGGDGRVEEGRAADQQIAFDDLKKEMREATTTADVTMLYNSAASSGEFTKPQLDELKRIEKERIEALQPQPAGKKR